MRAVLGTATESTGRAQWPSCASAPRQHFFSPQSVRTPTRTRSARQWPSAADIAHAHATSESRFSRANTSLSATCDALVRRCANLESALEHSKLKSGLLEERIFEPDAGIRAMSVRAEAAETEVNCTGPDPHLIACIFAQ